MTRRAGLTLVELLVALAVTGSTVGVGYATLSALADQRERVHGSSVATVRAASVRRQIVAWIEGAWVGADATPAFRLSDHVTRGRADDELVFVTTAATPLGRGDVVVRLFVDRDARTPERGLVAEFIEQYGPRAARLELDSTVVALDIRCITDTRGPRERLRTWLSVAMLPLGVDVRLASAPADRLAPLLRLPITVALQGGR